MYFSFLPSVSIDVKPIRYPFSESDFVVAKNFFRRYKLSDTAFNSAVYYKQYAINDDVRLDQIAQAVYGNSYYDWVIALVNNMMNPLMDLPMSENDLRKHVESSYDNPYYDIVHYEIIGKEQQIERFGKVIYKPGTIVDETFYNREVNLQAATFPNLTPSTETIKIINNFVFDDQEKDDVTLETFNTYYATNSNIGLQFNPVLRDDGYRSSTQIYLGNGGANSEQYVVTRPVDTSEYSTIEVYAGKVNSPAPGETLQLGYILDGGSYADTVYFADLLTYTQTDGVYKIKESLPEVAQAPNTKFVFLVSRDGTSLADYFAIQSYVLEGTYDIQLPLDFEWNKIDDDNYIIDGQAWTRVDGNWFKKISTAFQYYDGSKNVEVLSSQLCTPVTQFQYEQQMNEKKREIYILKPQYIDALVDDFKKAALYKQSSDFISNRLKKSGV
tara:strand:- start:1212 stop:2537 length:1326 start_codon:yes stop_codon:yes gene_type:complete